MVIENGMKTWDSGGERLPAATREGTQAHCIEEITRKGFRSIAFSMSIKPHDPDGRTGMSRTQPGNGANGTVTIARENERVFPVSYRCGNQMRDLAMKFKSRPNFSWEG
jgi:hypothetical protein